MSFGPTLGLVFQAVRQGSWILAAVTAASYLPWRPWWQAQGSKLSLVVRVTVVLLCIRIVVATSVANYCSIEHRESLCSHVTRLFWVVMQSVGWLPFVGGLCILQLSLPIRTDRREAHRSSRGNGEKVQDLQIRALSPHEMGQQVGPRHGTAGDRQRDTMGAWKLVTL